MQPGNNAKRMRRAQIIFAVGSIVFYFFGLDKLPFTGPDEPRYAQVAREMWQRGDFVTPTLGGFTWFEKPALYYWLEIAAFKIFGVAEFSARLGAALCGLLTIALTYAVARRLNLFDPPDEIVFAQPTTAPVAETETSARSAVSTTFEPAWQSAICLATSLGFIAFARSVNFDIALTLTVTATLYFFWRVETAENPRAGLDWQRAAFYAGLGCGLLAKGLAGVVLPGGAIALYFVLRRRFPARAWLFSLFWGVPFGLAVAAVWYFPVIQRHGWKFVDEFFIQHHFARYTSNKYSHPQPVYFYFLILPALLLPWSLFFLSGARRTLAATWRAFGSNDQAQSSRAFVLAWTLFPVLFFSLSGSKLPGYILPAVPGAALLAGAELARFIQAGGKLKWLLRATATLFIISGAGAFGYAAATRIVPLWSAGLIAVITISAGVFAWRTTVAAKTLDNSIVAYHRAIYALAIAVTFAVSIVLNSDLSGVVRRENVKALIATADARGYGDLPLYHLHTIEYNAAFYGAGRLVYDAQGKPVKFEGGGEVAQLARSLQRPFLLLALHEYAHQVTEHRDLQAELIATNGQVDIFVINLK